jgi:hypothetical protein
VSRSYAEAESSHEFLNWRDKTETHRIPRLKAELTKKKKVREVPNVENDDKNWISG